MSCKMPVAWHENNLKNVLAYRFEKKRLLDVLSKQLLRLDEEISIQQKQIAEAKKRGLDCFDMERFLMKRKAAKS